MNEEPSEHQTNQSPWPATGGRREATTARRYTRRSRSGPIRSQAHELLDVSPLLDGIFRGLVTYGVTEAFARNVLSAISRRELANGIRTLSKSAAWMEQCGSVAYRHANGFLKLPLAELLEARVRLHYWAADCVGEENVHDHRWNLASRVVLGTLVSEAYDYNLVDGPSNETAPQFAYQAYAYGKARPGLSAELRHVGERILRLESRIERFEGSAYYLHHDRLHRVVKRDDQPTITLMVQSPTLRSENQMCSSRPEAPDVDPVALGAEGLAAVLPGLISLIEGK